MSHVIALFGSTDRRGEVLPLWRGVADDVDRQQHSSSVPGVSYEDISLEVTDRAILEHLDLLGNRHQIQWIAWGERFYRISRYTYGNGRTRIEASSGVRVVKRSADGAFDWVTITEPSPPEPTKEWWDDQIAKAEPGVPGYLGIDPALPFLNR